MQSRNPGKYTLGPGANQSDKTGRGWIFDTDWTYGPTRFHVQGWVAFRVFVAGPYGLEEGGGWCDNGGPGADYTWSVAADTLTLKPVGGRDACPYRNAVWPGTWMRVALERQEGLRKQALFAHSELSGLDHCVGWESRNSYNERTKNSVQRGDERNPGGDRDLGWR